jgi:hypothetical protein
LGQSDRAGLVLLGFLFVAAATELYLQKIYKREVQPRIG